MSLQACGTGCLKASEDCTCIISDIVKGYKIENGTAVKANIDQCVVNDFEGSCLGCNSSYYLDLANNKCVAVEEAAKIENCEDYTNGTTCGSCKSGFFLDGTACTAVDPLINDCDTYSSAILCSSCDSGFFPSTDYKSCVANPKESNCVAYSYVSCAACSTGFVKVLNGYLVGLRNIDSSAGQLALAANVVGWSLNGDNIMAQTACETALASNCAAFDAGVNVCNDCNAGFFLTEAKLCEKYPEEPLVNCQDYSSVTNCIKCISGHYFKSSVCTAIPADSQKPNCTKYDNAATSVTCIECSSNHYLSSNSCKDRDKSKDNSIANCATKSITADKCAACSTNFYLTDDGLECLAAHANCVSYNSVNKGGTLVCNKCEDGFYLKTNSAADADPKTECLAGEVDNCAQYQSGSPTVCTTCKNGFISESGACNASNSISGCTVYDATDKTACDKCTDDSNFNFQIVKKCSPITNQVQNCKSHDGGTVAAPTCETCNDGYEKDGNNCTQLTIANCLSQSGSTNCSSCKAGFALSEDTKSCISPLSWLTEQCHTNSTSSSNGDDVKNVTCSVCKEHAYPLDFQDQYVCVGTSDFVQYTTDEITTNCIRYNSDVECVQCDPNATNKFLSSSDTCVDTCGAGAAASYHLVDISYSGTPDKIEITGFNVCDSPADAGGLVDAPDSTVHDSDHRINIGCVISTHFPVLTAAEGAHTLYDPTGATAYPYSPSAWFKYPQVTCTAHGSEDIDDTDADAYNFDDNCDFYILAGTNRYTCLRCKFGYSGTIGEGASSGGQLSNCVADSDCSPTQYYNIPTTWNLLFSCHVCNDSSKIPFVAFSGAAAGDDVTFSKWAPWGLNPTRTDGTPNSYSFVHTDVTKDQKNVVCLANAHTAFTNFESGDYDKVDNCALAFIDLAQTTGITNHTGTEVYVQGCAACKPGYRVVAADLNHTVIKDCTVIDNCAGGNLVNGCNECDTNYVLKYDGEVLVEDEKACISIPTSSSNKFANCWAASEEGNSGNAEECKICERGYTLNADKVCEQIKPANCQAGQFRIHGQQAVTANNKAQILWAQGYAAGCSQCESSYVAIGVKTGTAPERHYCVSSGWIQNNVDSITDENTTSFIPHCKLYKASTTSDGSTDYVCEECDTSYVIHGNGTTKLGTKCYPGTSLGNCEIASSDSNCTKCVNNTFGLVNNSCIAGNIANCVAYNFDNNQTQVKCITCAAGFYLTSENKCDIGKIKNCKEFVDNQAEQCEVCEDGHVLTNVGSNIKYCYPIAEDLNCSALNYGNNVVGGQVTCNTCSNPQTHLVVEVASSENSTICINFVSIANCIRYDVNDTLNNSTFNCNKCAEGFFYNEDTNECVERKNKPNKCTTYDDKKDECTACGSNSYLHDLGKQCKDYPKGILGCSTYSDANTCSACKAKRYLNDNACPLADPEIANCSTYSSKTVCATCETNHVLVNNECKQANALNCVTYQSVDACASCGPDDGLETSGGVTSCVNKTKAGCANIDDNTPYNCTLCNSGFYLDAGECKNPTTITNCITYSGKETCELCEKGFALTTDKKNCTNEGLIGSLVPSECQEASVVNTPVCSRCGPGYWFVQDKCEELCSGDGKEGCFTCDPKTPEKCFICQSGYHMEKEQVCKKDGTDGGETGDKPDTISAGKFGIFSIIVALLVFLR